MTRRKTIRIGIITDTHGLFDPAVRRYFKNVDHILHAGDIGNRSVIEQLEQIAPVTAVSGNVDNYEQSSFPSEAVLDIAGRRFAIRHILYEGGKMTKEGQAFLKREQPDVCIFGHTHQPKTEWFDKTLLFNPGSAGPKRFKLLRGIGLLYLRGAEVKPRLISLADKVRHSSWYDGENNLLARAVSSANDGLGRIPIKSVR
jgi:putative phosphoesterase